MSRSGQGAGRRTRAVTRTGGSRPVPQASDSGFKGQAVLGLVGLGMVGRVLRSRRSYERLAVAVIVLGALRRIGQENRASTLARLQAWNNREIQRLGRRHPQGRAVKGAARTELPGSPRGLAGAGPET